MFMTAEKPDVVVHKRSAPKAAGPSCVDVFSGAGGLAVGFRDAGWSILAGNDADADAGSTFRLNFPEATFFEGPISGVTADALLKACGLKTGELDCLIGGPPCQSFSHNNHHRSALDDRARLFEDYLRLVEGLKPRTLVMENVPGILSIDNGSVMDEIAAKLATLKYTTTYRVLSSEEFGTPQIRRRVFIVATRLGDAADLLPAPTHASASKFTPKTVGSKDIKQPRRKRIVTVDAALGDLPALENGGGVQTMRRPGTAAYSEFQRAVRKGTRTVYNHVCHALTDVNLKRIVHVPEGGNWRDVPRDLLTAGMQRARASDHTKRYGRLARKGLASTILTKCDPHWGAYVHPTQDRTISVREAARLQGFPDRFRFAGTSISKQYEQVGNAVPVPVAKALGMAAANHLKTRVARTDAASDSPEVPVAKAA